MNKARRELVNTLMTNDRTLTPKQAYDLTRKFEFAGALKKRLTEKGIDVSKRRAFTEDELKQVQATVVEMEAELNASVVEDIENANPNS